MFHNSCACSPQLSLGDLEEMMLCLQHFRLVHSNIEEQLSEDHVSLHRALSDQDRYTLLFIKLCGLWHVQAAG